VPARLDYLRRLRHQNDMRALRNHYDVATVLLLGVKRTREPDFCYHGSVIQIDAQVLCRRWSHFPLRHPPNGLLKRYFTNQIANYRCFERLRD